MKAEHDLIAIASITALGIGAQWIAWLLRIPAILLLLAFGFLAGPVTGVLDPDALFGDILLPVVSVSVAVILFEGGLGLRIADLEETGRVVRNLVSLGASITWLAGAAAAYWIVGVDRSIAVLLGSILVVTGPTVIGPMLRQIRPSRRVGSILKWEGIVIDPIGAVLAVLVFEVVFMSADRSPTLLVAVGVAKTAIVGGVFGAAGAGLLALLLRRYWIPDYLQGTGSLMLTIVVFATSNVIQAESGLLAVTVMGILLANQRIVSIKHIAEFKENLGVLIVSSLFILLAARLDPQDIVRLGWRGPAFVAVLILVVRPLSVLASTLGSSLSWGERLFIAALAPRGIVAASVASVFALRLADSGRAEAGLLVPLTFLAIIGTVAVYAPTAPAMARILGLSRPRPQGVLFVGAHPWARALAGALRDQGVPTLMVDTNYGNVQAARLAGLRAELGNVLAEEATDRLDLNGIGRVLALTSNDEVNALAALHFVDVFGRAEVYQLVTKGEAKTRKETSPGHLKGRFLFGRDATRESLERRFQGGAVVRTTRLTEKFDFGAYRARYGDSALPLFLVSEERALAIFTVNDPPAPRPGQTLISLVEGDRPEAV